MLRGALYEGSGIPWCPTILQLRGGIQIEKRRRNGQGAIAGRHRCRALWRSW